MTSRASGRRSGTLKVTCVVLSVLAGQVLHARIHLPQTAPVAARAWWTGQCWERDSGRPIYGVALTLRASWPAGALTDTNGHFVFTGLAVGHYTLQATKVGFVAGSAPQAEETAGFELSRTAEAVDVILHLRRAATLSGHVLDGDGRPLAGMAVELRTRRVIAGAVSLQKTNVASITDDRGAFRLFGIAPGRYVLAVLPNEELEAHWMKDGEVRALAGAWSSGAPRVDSVAPTVQSSKADNQVVSGFSPSVVPDGQGCRTPSPLGREARDGISIVLALAVGVYDSRTPGTANIGERLHE